MATAVATGSLLDEKKGSKSTSASVAVATDGVINEREREPEPASHLRAFLLHKTREAIGNGANHTYAHIPT
jgi:hypothetical protein